MQVRRATHLGMCFGVRDAIRLALHTAQHQPITLLGELVHNPTVLRRLADHGVRTANDAKSADTPTVMITAHGTSNQQRRALETAGLNVVEATCPLVRFAHHAVLNLAQAGYHPVIVGRRDHVEVRGLTGDLAQFDVVRTEAEVLALPERVRFGVVAQTTQPIAHVRYLVEVLKRRHPASEVRFVDTVCQPTKQRQTAAGSLARACDVMVVVGGANSNNTLELVNTCRRSCPRVLQVQSAEELRAEWFAGANLVGLTAGTSTPDDVIAAVEQWLQRLAGDALTFSEPAERNETTATCETLH